MLTKISGQFESYKGISVRQLMKSQSPVVKDVELVNQDLLNHIFTRKGERVMMSGFGTGVQDAVFEQMTSDLLDNIEDDLRAVVEFDPRVNLVGIETVPVPDKNEVVFVLELNYIYLNYNGRLDVNIKFESTGDVYA